MDHHHPEAVEILSDDDPMSPFASKNPLPCKDSSPSTVVIADDPTPQKKSTLLSPSATNTPLFVPETPLSPGPTSAGAADSAIIRCTLAPCDSVNRCQLPDKFYGITGLIYLDSDNESDKGSPRRSTKESKTLAIGSDINGCSQLISEAGSPVNRDYCKINNELYFRGKLLSQYRPGGIRGTSDRTDIVEDSSRYCNLSTEDFSQLASSHDMEPAFCPTKCGNAKRKKSHDPDVAAKKSREDEAAARKKILKEEKARLLEERKQRKQQEKLEKAALKTEEAQRKKLEQEQKKWENGKVATKSIVAEIDAKVVEKGSIGGPLLTRLAEKDVLFRITSNPIERSILWKMTAPDHIARLSSTALEVPYISIIYEAEEFCDLLSKKLFFDHVHRVRSQYPSFTICYLTIKLMSYIDKCEQSSYKNATNGPWMRPLVEEVLARLTISYMKVHSRQCRDGAELGEHIAGLTLNLAKCHFRKKITWLSINANGSIIPKDFIDKKLIKSNLWLKALIAVPKVQPRFAVAIAKKYPTMRSLLNEYMDPEKTVHQKETLLENLTVEDVLGNESRRLGVNCSKRVYRILMAQNGSIKTDDIENGADYFIT